MKRITQLAVIVGLFLAAFSNDKAQNGALQLAKVAKALECLQQDNRSGWKRERVKPITGSEGVLIYMYVSSGRRVKVSITYYPSDLAATNVLQNFASGTPTKNIPNIGDEAYAWGSSDEIAVRKSNLTVFVSSITDIDSLLPLLDQGEKSSLRRTEEVALNKNFATMMANVLSNVDAACQPMERI
jgi:hypothetical protein